MALKNGGQNKAALELLAPRAGESVIELGCGPGTGVRAALKRVGRGGFVAGVDQSATAAHYAAHVVHRAVLRGNAVIMRAEAADLPFRDLMFDRAFAVNTFQFWPDPARALREVARVLAPQQRDPASAHMTVAFSVGQIVGPALGGWLAERTGSFASPSWMAAAVLLTGAALTAMAARTRVQPTGATAY